MKPSHTRRGFAAALERARRRVLAAGRSNVFAYIVRERGEFGPEHVILTNAEYQEFGREDDCLAVVWSYVDDSGRLAAAMETEADW